MFDSVLGFQAPSDVSSSEPATGLIARAKLVIAMWRARAKERSQLVGLDERMLRDIGLTKAELWKETNKVFWRP